MTPRAAAVTFQRVCFTVALSLALAACGDGSNDDAAPRDRRTPDTLPPGPNQAPVARFSPSPLGGIAPLAVTVDASASGDDRDGIEALLFRWDVDGDGTFDTEALPELRVHVINYTLAGTYRPKLEVTDKEGASSTVESASPIVVTTSSAPAANLDVDTNRDGVVTQLDDEGEGTWTPARGAITIANVDDDDGDGDRDWRDANLDGLADLEDTSPLIIRRSAGLTTEHTITLRVSPAAAAGRLRLFAGEGTSRTVVYAPEAGEVVLDRARLSSTDLPLAVEAITGRSQQWDGLAELTLEISKEGVVVSTDTVQMRAAPVIFTDDMLRAEVLFVMRIDRDENGENRAFQEALVRDLPAHIRLYDVDELAYGADRWVQDNMQVGYQARPVGATTQVIRTYLQTQRPGGLSAFVPNEVIDDHRGFFFPGGDQTSLNSGGNLEVAPPHSVGSFDYPHGRLIVGGGRGGTLVGQQRDEHMADRQREWLDAQEVQGPALQVSTEWLAVGHVDEIFLFVPDHSAAATKPYKVVIASPALARSLLVQLSNAGWGNQTVFAGRSSQTYVDAILSDDSLMSFNEAAQARIDGVRLQIAQAVGLTDADFIEVPVLYEAYNYDGAWLAAAYNPGMQNLVVGDDVLFVPDPEGPVGPGGQDVWRAAAASALSVLGLELTFVDVFDSYHLLMGEAHCGTNFERQPYAAPWWE